MKHNSVKDKGLNIVRYSPVPDFITCPDCGYKTELWSEELATVCLFCGYRLFRKEMTIH